MRVSGLLSEDRDAAVRTRQRARTRSQVGRDGRHRKNTDELTNEGTHNGGDPLPDRYARERVTPICACCYDDPYPAIIAYNTVLQFHSYLRVHTYPILY